MAHTRGHCVKAIMEGVIYSLQDSLEIVEELGIPVEQIRTSGGGARSALWRQIQSDIFAKNVVTLTSEHGAAYGVGLLAAVGAGAFKNIEEACDVTIAVAKETKFDKQATDYYRRAFPIYRELYTSLKDDFKSIARLEKEHAKVPSPLVAK
jgi:xylulokinase